MTQIFLFAPDGIDAGNLLACAKAAVTAGDCASIVVPGSTAQATVAGLQALGLATLLRDCAASQVHDLKADGLHLTDTANLKESRETLKNESLGVFAGTSRHLAMEAAEAGADYVAFAQTKQFAGEPLIGWWQAVTQLPSVAIDPVEPESLAKLLTQNPDFIRPSDAMWQDAQMAENIISTLNVRMGGGGKK